MNMRLSPFLILVFYILIVTNITGQVILSPDYKFDIYINESSFLRSGIAKIFLYNNHRQIKQPVDYNNLINSVDSFQKAELIASNDNFDI